MGYEITVIITAYNLDKYIDACLSELKSQTFQDFSILLVDDASTDRTLEKALVWKSVFFDRLSIVKNEHNLGMPALARNKALDSGLVNGKYILFLDGDDSIEQYMLEKMHDSVVKNNSDVAICAYDRIDDSTGKRLAIEMRGFPKLIKKDSWGDEIAFINTAPWNKLWKTEIIHDLRYPAFKVGEEVSFNFLAYQRCASICFVDDVLVRYRVRPNSVIAATDEETIWKFAQALADLHERTEPFFRPVLELLIFLHIGLSMAVRAAFNPKISLRTHINKTGKYFSQRYNWFKNNRMCAFSNLSKRGVKGLAIWGCLLMYRLNMFALPLFIYKKLNLKIKF